MASPSEEMGEQKMQRDTAQTHTSDPFSNLAGGNTTGLCDDLQLGRTIGGPSSPVNKNWL